MATYGRQYHYNPARRKKQRYALVERVVDFSKTPVTGGVPDQPNSANIVTAWAAADVLQAIKIKAGQTVMGVEIEIMQRSTTADARIKVGYGSDADYWGVFSIATTSGGALLERANARTAGVHKDQQRNFGNPLYFASADTIDLTLTKAITAGKIRVIVHLLEDDR